MQARVQGEYIYIYIYVYTSDDLSLYSDRVK